MMKVQDFQKLFEEAPIGLALCAMDGRLLIVNQAFADIIGRSTDEVPRLNYRNITPREYEKQEAALLTEINKKGRYGPYEKHYIHKDGSRIPVRLQGRCIELDGTPYIWSSVEKLETPIHSVELFKEAPVGLALCRMDGRLVAVNQAYADLIGRSIDETLRLGYRNLTPKQYAKQEDEQIEQLKKRGTYGPYSKHYIHKDGRLVPVTLVGKLLRINQEDFIWSVCQKGEEIREPVEKVDDPIPILDGGPIHQLTDELLYTVGEVEPMVPFDDADTGDDDAGIDD